MQNLKCRSVYAIWHVFCGAARANEVGQQLGQTSQLGRRRKWIRYEPKPVCVFRQTSDSSQSNQCFGAFPSPGAVLRIFRWLVYTRYLLFGKISSPHAIWRRFWCQKMQAVLIKQWVLLSYSNLFWRFLNKCRIKDVYETALCHE